MASIKDVAKKANVGIATVSRVLNKSGSVSQETRELVLQAIDELGYIPNELARNFQKRQTNFIGVIAPSLVHRFTSELLAQIEKDLSDLGYFLLLFVSNRDVSKEIDYLERLKSQQVVGTIIVAPFISIERSYQFSDLPLVAFDRKINPKIPCIHVDNYRASKELSERLLEKSKKKLAFVGFAADPKSLSQERLDAFKESCEQQGREYEVFDMIEYDNDYQYLVDVYNQTKDFDGFFMACDYHAQLFINVLLNNQVIVGKDVFLVSFDGLSDNHLTRPLLTTAVQDVKEISKALIDALMKRINQDEQMDETIEVRYHIQEGETC
jgi:DNA-binding LacI/PurR family transcriptional regulator